MAAGEVTLFPDVGTRIWTLLNLALLVGIPAVLAFGVIYVVRLGRRVRHLEERLNEREK